MSKAEKENRTNSLAVTFLERQQIRPNIFADQIMRGYKEGYHQAEKDLELTWEDIKIILDIENDILRECNSHKELVIKIYPKGEDYYDEILKRFKESKKNENNND